VADHRPTPPRGPLGASAPGANQPAPPIGPLGANQPAPPVGPLAAAHERHDLLLVAAYASDDLDGAARTAAAELVAGCSACADLATDLRTLAAATHDLPPARRPRDFFLSSADATRLRPRGLRRLLAAFAAPTLPIRPLATGLTTLGVAGLLVASLPGILPFGGAASSPMLESTGQAVGDGLAEETPGGVHGYTDRTVGPAPTSTSAPAAASPAAVAAESPAPTPGPDTANVPVSDDPGPQKATPASDTAAEPVDESERERDAVGGEPSALAIWSAIALVAGLGLFALRRLGARIG
jgi:hypothetical protein